MFFLSNYAHQKIKSFDLRFHQTPRTFLVQVYLNSFNIYYLCKSQKKSTGLADLKPVYMTQSHAHVTKFSTYLQRIYCKFRSSFLMESVLMCTAILEQSKVYGIYLGLDELFRILWVMEVCTTRKTGIICYLHGPTPSACLIQRKQGKGANLQNLDFYQRCSHPKKHPSQSPTNIKGSNF